MSSDDDDAGFSTPPRLGSPPAGLAQWPLSAEGKFLPYGSLAKDNAVEHASVVFSDSAHDTVVDGRTLAAIEVADITTVEDNSADAAGEGDLDEVSLGVEDSGDAPVEVLLDELMQSSQAHHHVHADEPPPGSMSATELTDESEVSEAAWSSEGLYRFFAMPSFLSTAADELPAPLPPTSLITIPPLIRFVVKDQKIPPPPDINFLPFGFSPAAQKDTFARFFSVVFTLIAHNEVSQLEKVLKQLGRDCQKFGYDIRIIEEIVSAWQFLFAPIAREEFVGWLGCFPRAIAAGLEQPIEVHSATVIGVDHHHDVMVIHLLSDEPMMYRSGQFCELMSERHPGHWQYCSFANPADASGHVDIHLHGRDHLFADTMLGDTWYMGQFFGDFPLIAESAASLTCIGVETGIAPLRSLILSHHEQGCDKPIRLITITENELWFEHQIFCDLAASTKWFELHSVTAPGQKFLPQDVLSLLHNRDDDILLSGPAVLVSTLKSLIVQCLGIPDHKIHLSQRGILGIDDIDNSVRTHQMVHP